MPFAELERAQSRGGLGEGARHLAKYALGWTGLEVSRVRRRSPAPAEPLASAGLVVELMGPSGVGKTETLRQAAPDLASRWYFQEDIGFYLANALKAPPERQALYENLARRRFQESFGQPRHLAERSARTAYLLSVLNADMAMMSEGYHKGFLLHDGLCHNFSTTILQMLREGDRGAERLVRSRSYVFILADRVGTLVSRILKRRTATPAFRTNNFPSLSVSELEPMCRGMDRTAREFAERARALPAEVLVLRAEAPAEINREKLLDFEACLVSRAAPRERGQPALPVGAKEAGI